MQAAQVSFYGRLKDRKVQTLILIAEMFFLLLFLAILTGGRGIEWDEAFTWRMITKYGWSGIAAATAADVHPPLYYYLARLAITLFGAKLVVLAWVSILPTALSMLLSILYVRKR